jgi:hypothetical protein
MGQRTTLSCGILVRGNYVTNRCPRARQVACIRCRRPVNGSRLVKCQRRFQHWISTELLPTAE